MIKHMKPGDRRYTIEWLTSGQQRPYGNEIYKFYIKHEWIPYGKSELEFQDLDSAVINPIAIALSGKDWTKFSSENWHRPKLIKLEHLISGVWFYHIECEYTD